MYYYIILKGKSVLNYGGRKMELLVIAGLSGSGKTSVLQVLSEEKFVILESLSAEVTEEIIATIALKQADARVALVLRYTSAEDFNQKFEMVHRLTKQYTVTKMFLKTNKQILVNRYRELRKIHPLMLEDKNLLLEESLDLEVKITQQFKNESDLVIDTSDTSVKDLKQILLNYINKHYEFTINIISFGFKHGSVHEADYVFDVRFLPNPYYIKELRLQSGIDDAVYDYVFSFDEANEYYSHVLSLIKLAIAGFKKEKRLHTTIAFACTGGQHRSVSFARRLAKDLTIDNDVIIRHIERERGNW